jgi:hypothetical protein
MENNLAFHAILEREVNQLEFGQMDVNFIIQNGIVALPTINILKSMRKKYKDGRCTASNNNMI